jgi:hypothetical protein
MAWLDYLKNANGILNLAWGTKALDGGVLSASCYSQSYLHGVVLDVGMKKKS